MNPGFDEEGIAVSLLSVDVAGKIITLVLGGEACQVLGKLSPRIHRATRDSPIIGFGRGRSAREFKLAKISTNIVCMDDTVQQNEIDLIDDDDKTKDDLAGKTSTTARSNEELSDFKRLIHSRVKSLRWSAAQNTVEALLDRPSGQITSLSAPSEPRPWERPRLSTSRPHRLAKNMPHAVSMPQTGFQALVLCGPGLGLTTFTSVPKEYPKALIPIANRPMVWYVLDWCYRSGITNITLVTPPDSEQALSAALSQHPDLTSLPSPSPDILAPKDLTHETGTAELLRLPEVQDCIVSDFLLLPCDLVCEVPGESLLESWMTSLGGLGGVTDGSDLEVSGPKMVGLGGEKGGRRGGLGVYYPTKNREESVKKEECDFICTALPDDKKLQSFSDRSDLPGTVRKLVWEMPMSSLADQCEEDKSWKVRSSLLQRYGFVKCLTTFRDAHIYLFPYWVKDFAKLNEEFESVSEDLVGTWAKSEWRKPSYRAQFHVKEVFNKPRSHSMTDYYETPLEEEIDLLSLSSTQTTRHTTATQEESRSVLKRDPISFASRVSGAPSSDSPTDLHPDSVENLPLVPPMLAYLHGTSASSPLIRRVDSSALLLSVSLLLAKLPPSLSDSDPSSSSSATTTNVLSPLAHPTKIHPTATIASRTTISQPDSLIGPNASISEKCVIKESVIGSSVTVGQGSRLTRCVIMDGAVIGEKCLLTDTIIGKKAVIGAGCDLRDCEVQDGMGVGVKKEGVEAGEEGEAVEAKGEKFMIGGFEDDDGDGFGDEDAGEGVGEEQDVDLAS